jgi:hypothetical protein
MLDLPILPDPEKNMDGSTTTLTTSLRQDIDERLAALSPEVRSQVVDHFATIERDRRAQLIVSGVTRLREMETDLKKINQPDQLSFGPAGEKLTETYSKGKVDAIGKKRKEIEKLSTSLDKALGGDFGDLEKALKGGGKPEKTESDQPE